ncbi:MAG: phosphoglycerate kinase [Candidatus Latescibacterota bacterium]|nr:MAG: phosphoglycerate kinase [Candidatus Latescibacterota bacterium]
MRKKTLRDADLRGRRVLMRVDFNVPLSKQGDIADDTRVRASLPSIDYIVERGGSVVLVSHLGRPKGAKNKAYTLRPVADCLGGLVNHPVKFADDCVGPGVEKLVAGLAPGEIALLENLRFYPEEEANDPGFAKQLASYGDLYANDAFGTAHRAHASTEGVTRHFKENVAGFLMEREIDALEGLLESPARPFVAVLGGAKVSGKLELIRNLLARVDRVLVGGGMAFTFFKAAGLEIGKSLVDDALVPECRALMEDNERTGRKRILLPVDCLVAPEISAAAAAATVSTGDIPEDMTGVDIGERTVELFREELAAAKTVFWNGPMGVFEIPQFSAGTRKIARIMADITKGGAATVVGGGDSVAALNQAGLAGSVSHVSTGGGASLELLEGKKLPGVEALTDR